MSFIEVLAATILSFILREAPNVQRHERLKQDFAQDIETVLVLHDRVQDGRLVDEQTDMLILSAVTYRESRFRLPAPDGDCSMTHPLIKAPSGQWPAGYVPVMKQVCRAVGPQQLNRGNTAHLPPWPEIQKLFSEREWSTPEGRRKDRLTEAQLRDPETNIRLSYGILEHWKNECRHKDDSVAPVGVWFTAYRYGRCPFHYKTDKYYIDSEAKTRCELIQKMADGFDSSVYTLPKEYRCTYGKEPKRQQSAKLAQASTSAG